MTNSYKENSATQWEWQDGNKHLGVQLFGSTRTLIWSAWTDSSSGPQFEDGIRQSFEHFIRDGTPYASAPAELVQKILAKVEELNEKRALTRNSWRWFRNRISNLKK